MAILPIEILGWIGVSMVFIGYLLITAEKVKSTSILYQGLNLIGSSLIAVNAFFNMAYPSVVANITWMMVAIYGFSRIRRIKKH